MKPFMNWLSLREIISCLRPNACQIMDQTNIIVFVHIVWCLDEAGSSKIQGTSLRRFWPQTIKQKYNVESLFVQGRNTCRKTMFLSFIVKLARKRLRLGQPPPLPVLGLFLGYSRPVPSCACTGETMTPYLSSLTPTLQNLRT